MKAILKTLLLMACCCLPTSAAFAGNREIGAKFPLEKLSAKTTPADNTIVVFLPSLTHDCVYAGMLTQSFYYYFDQKLAFDRAKKRPAIQIFLVVNDRQNQIKSQQNIIGDMKVLYDENGELFAALGQARPTHKNADATVVLLDAQERIALVDEHYRAQGEHLKPLENKLKELNGLRTNVKPANKTLKVGDKAPDFKIDDQTKLSDLRGQVVLVSFYPAAFSGVLPQPEPPAVAQTEPGSLTSTKPESITVTLTNSATSDLQKNLMACFIQIDVLDKRLNDPQEARRLVVSSSTGPLLEKWRQVLGTRNIEYVNDADYAVSLRYGSYNPNGYNNRVSVIIDQKGRIAYLDKDFDFNDEIILNAKIAELLPNKKL